ncbi:MAG TPA: DinB family protein [Gemmatimonadaceae bacterium]|nr:DinB family protein [Gemmatimonadaceae bacterium]
MRSRHPALFGITTFAALLLVAVPLGAQDVSPGKQAYLDDLAFIEGRYVSLAEAMPEDSYGWRPGEGVRSVAEVFTHVAFANYLFGEILGTPMPADIKARYPTPKAFEAVKSKQEILDMLRASFAHGRSVVTGITDAQFNSQVKMFGRDTPFPSALLTYVTHNHEHLGQAIAYARTNKVVPPWSAGN